MIAPSPRLAFQVPCSCVCASESVLRGLCPPGRGCPLCPLPQAPCPPPPAHHPSSRAQQAFAHKGAGNKDFGLRPLSSSGQGTVPRGSPVSSRVPPPPSPLPPGHGRRLSGNLAAASLGPLWLPWLHTVQGGRGRGGGPPRPLPFLGGARGDGCLWLRDGGQRSEDQRMPPSGLGRWRHLGQQLVPPKGRADPERPPRAPGPTPAGALRGRALGAECREGGMPTGRWCPHHGHRCTPPHTPGLSA